MNNRILAEKLRPIWERSDELKNFTEDAKNVQLFSSEKDKDSKLYTTSVNLNIDVKALEKCIEDRIRLGVINFFQSLYSAFKGKTVYPIHIFLAGNSCKSPVVKKLFDEFITEEERKLAEATNKDASGTFILHLPLGMKATENGTNNSTINSEKLEQIQNVTNTFNLLAALKSNDDTNSKEESPSVPSTQIEQIDMELDRRRTGKTGVAFGLLRCRRGGKDVKIINCNVDENDEMIFPYFLGDAGFDGNTFTVRIGRDVGYGTWVYFTVADETDFEIYYTSIPRALQGKMTTAQVSMIHCIIDDAEVSDDDDVGVYIRKVTPNKIEYAVGRKEDFDKDEEQFKNEFKGRIYEQKL